MRHQAKMIGFQKKGGTSTDDSGLYRWGRFQQKSESSHGYERRQDEHWLEWSDLARTGAREEEYEIRIGNGDMIPIL